MKRIEKLMLPRLQEAYLAELNNIAGLTERKVKRLALPDAVSVQTYAGIELNEHLLYHGAPSSVVERLIVQGIDPRRAGSHFGALFGVGGYFASLSSKSDIYTKPVVEVHTAAPTRAGRLSIAFHLVSLPLCVDRTRMANAAFLSSACASASRTLRKRTSRAGSGGSCRPKGPTAAVHSRRSSR